MVKFVDIQNNIVVSIGDILLNEIKEHSIQSYPNETGGFLVGKYLSNNHAHVQCLIQPTVEKSGPTSYVRSTGGMKQIWNNLYDKGLIYLGEWHTHPNGSCDYSFTDLEAIRSIASSKGVNIKRPLLLIASINKEQEQNINIYHYDYNQLIKLYKWEK